MVLIKQCNDTFIRQFGNIGYISNQLTKHDRVYDSIGAIFLNTLSRDPQTIEDIVNRLYPIFVNVQLETLKEDFLEFAKDIEADRYIISGDTISELQTKEPIFSYKTQNPKTTTQSYFKKEKCFDVGDTQEFLERAFRNDPTLFDMQIEITSRCNERCVHCYLPNKPAIGGDIDKLFMFDILDQLKELGTLGVTITGGEPLLHKNFCEILTYARKNDFVVSVLSNGVLLSSDIIQCLKEARINQIQISLYSMKAEEHDAITNVNGSHKHTLSNIEKMIAADIPVQISCPIMKINQLSYGDVLRWASNHQMKANTDCIMMAKSDFDTSNLDYRLPLQETRALLVYL